jgi:hypothetical protein
MKKIKSGNICVYSPNIAKVYEVEPIHEYVDQIILVLNSDPIVNLFMCYCGKRWNDENVWTFYKRELKVLC